MTNQIWLTVQPGSESQGERPKLPSDSRTKILEAAFAALSRDGYENASIKDIAAEAGVAQGLVHYYFKSKQQLVLAVLFEVCKKMDVYTAEGEQGAMAAFENFKTLLRTRPDAHTLYIQLIGVGLHDAEIGAGILGIMVQKMVDPDFNADEAVDALAAMSLQAVYPSRLETA